MELGKKGTGLQEGSLFRKVRLGDCQERASHTEPKTESQSANQLQERIQLIV